MNNQFTNYHFMAVLTVACILFPYQLIIDILEIEIEEVFLLIGDRMNEKPANFSWNSYFALRVSQVLETRHLALRFDRIYKK